MLSFVVWFSLSPANSDTVVQTLPALRVQNYGVDRGQLFSGLPLCFGRGKRSGAVSVCCVARGKVSSQHRTSGTATTFFFSCQDEGNARAMWSVRTSSPQSPSLPFLRKNSHHREMRALRRVPKQQASQRPPSSSLFFNNHTMKIIVTFAAHRTALPQRRPPPPLPPLPPPEGCP